MNVRTLAIDVATTMRSERDEFTCQACLGAFRKAWTDEEALAESASLFPDEDDMAVVCDDCWKELGLD